jgi:queuosine precursor transporter
MKYLLSQKHLRLFIVLAGFFVTNAIVAEFIGVKIFAFEETFGLPLLSWNLFGQSGSLNLTAGVLLWPVVFIMTDLINEYYGQKGVRVLSLMTAGLIAYAFIMVAFAIGAEPAGWWTTSHIDPNWSESEKQAALAKVSDYDAAFGLVFGQGQKIIVASLVAFLVGQLLDAYVFAKIKKITGESKIWLRATGSTLISQFIDSYIVLFLAFYVGGNWSITLVLAVGVVNYTYKFIMALLLTPVLYLVHELIERYLGKELADKMKREALGG